MSPASSTTSLAKAIQRQTRFKDNEDYRHFELLLGVVGASLLRRIRLCVDA